MAVKRRGSSPTSPSSRRNVCSCARCASSDAEAMFAYASDPEVTRYVLWETHGSIEDSENFLRFANEGYERGDFGGWGLVLKASGAFVGTCGMEAAPNTRAPSSGTCSHASTGEGASCPRPYGA